MQTISNIEKLIERLGGVTRAAHIFGEKVNVVGNWQMRRKLPANKFLRHQEILLEHGISASPRLWFEGDRQSLNQEARAS